MKLLLISLKDNSNWMCEASICLPVMCYYRLRQGNVFSHVCLSVCQFTGGGGHVTITYHALNLTLQGLPALVPASFRTRDFTVHVPHPLTKSPLDMEPHCTRTPLPNRCPTGVNIWWMRSGSGRYASPWNAFLL